MDSDIVGAICHFGSPASQMVVPLLLFTIEAKKGVIW